MGLSVPTLLLLVTTFATILSARSSEPQAAPAFSADELKRIATLGPWPPAFTRDTSNRVSGKPLAIELGRRMFSDARMSPVGYIGCVTCHQPDRAFTDLRARAHGLADLPRNTPSLANLRLQRWYGWSGASDSLWMASIRPMLDARELDSSPAFVKRVFERDPELASCYRKVFGEPPRENRRTVVNVGKALAAFEETLVTARTPFDDFRDAVLRGGEAAARYPHAARRGLALFVGAGGCIRCHAGPNFSDGEFHRIGAGANAFAHDDSGRLEGAQILVASAFNLLGRYNDDRSRTNANDTARVVAADTLRGQFRTPSLRNVAVTGPWLHDGRSDRLRDAIAHSDASTATRLDDGQIGDVEAFLRTLTDVHGERRPWPAAGAVRCP